MAANAKQLAMRAALVNGFLNADSPTCGDFRASVLAAGYSMVSLLTRSTRYRRWISEEQQERGIGKRQAQPKEPVRPRSSNTEFSPVSGREWLPRERAEIEQRGLSHPDPAPKESRPYTPQEFVHPQLGECVRSIHGGNIPLSVRDPYQGGLVDLTSAAVKQVELRRSNMPTYTSGPPGFAAPDPRPPVYAESPVSREPRYKDESRDVAGEALAGRYGFGEIRGQVESPTAEPLDEYERELFYASKEAKERFAALRR